MFRIIKINAMVLLALTMISCAASNSSIAQSQNDSTPSPMVVSTPAVVSTPTPQPLPNLIYEQNGDTVILTIRDIGIQMELPLEFMSVCEYQPEHIVFDFSREPFNGIISIACGSFMSIDFDQPVLDCHEAEEMDESYTTEKAVNGTNLYIMRKHETEMAVRYVFGREDFPCQGMVDVSLDFYRRYGDAIVNMLKTMAVVDTQDIDISPDDAPVLLPIADAEYENWHLLEVPSFDAAVYIPEGFEEVCTFSCSEGFASVSFDFTKPPFNEKVCYEYTENYWERYTSDIHISFYRGIEKKYPDYDTEFMAYSWGDSDPYLILIGFERNGKAVNYQVEDLQYEYGGIVSVSRDFYDRYENEILDMLTIRPIEAIR